MVYQSQRREWRKRRRRRKMIRFLLRILIIILIFCSIGYGGKKFYDKYITKTSKGADTSKITNITDSTEDSEETNESKQTEATDILDNADTSDKPDGTENSDKLDKPDTSNKSDELENPDTSNKSDELENPDTSDMLNGVKKPDKQKVNENSENKVDESYFDDAVFIGDSRTEGFGMYSGLKNATFYTEKGLMVDTIFKDNSVKQNGNKVTIIDALKNQSFGKVYIMLGVNELGWPYDDVFINQYKKVIDTIKESQPQAEIYVQSIIHVSQEKDKNPPSYINNNRINNRNKLIKKMAKEEKVHYLNVNEVLTDKSGSLFEDASTDGVHLNQQYCIVWKDYLLKH